MEPFFIFTLILGAMVLVWAYLSLKQEQEDKKRGKQREDITL